MCVLHKTNTRQHLHNKACNLSSIFYNYIVTIVPWIVHYSNTIHMFSYNKRLGSFIKKKKWVRTYELDNLI